MIDAKLQQQLHEKYNPEGSVLRHAQLRMTEMLVFLDKVCTKYHLRYWLDSGTLLGACRHGGFIPWDDDTDVCMPIEDLRKLRQIFATEHLSDEFILQTSDNDKNYLRIEWCVLRDLKSEYVQNGYRFHRGLKYKGLQIDIFPVEKGIKPSLMKLANIYQRQFTNRCVLSKKIPYKFGMFAARIFRRFETAFIIPLFRLFNDESSDFFSYAFGCGFLCKHYVKTTLPLKKIPFEGYSLSVPNDTDAYLKDLYGDWEKLPPEDEIHTHHVVIKFYEKPVNTI